ncbi:lysophospholipid acyltransferase family protein [Desulfovibrio mangrovi]|uniref:lysophospholipid acyltransferase family protein n=1 Tax=Desulfovibrio mangrovi TaxID=2976983 RepID=UPI0022486FA0|nr:lysophospholipid acyltransferase family protein [Desulfovibrio mangrovi]UZP68286.1 lysophospholipid acyltransferase family protein [Desulfovibrio mangrovi]
MKIPPKLLYSCIYWVVRAMYATLRFRETGRKRVDAMIAQGIPMVFSLWHDELFPVVHAKRDLELIAVISQSKDGELLADFMERFGVKTARGSSSRGGVKALLKVSKAMERDRLSSCITVDGPRGPRHKVKEGAVFVANRANAPIVPVRLHMSRSYKFKRAWDKFQIPIPFSSVHVAFGEPYYVPEGSLEKDAFDRECQKLEDRLNAL